MTSGDGTAGDAAGPGAGSVADDDARRWAQAEQRAAGVVVPDEWPVLRRFLLVELPIVLVVCVGLGVLGALLGGEWPESIGTAIMVAGLVGMIMGVVRAVRRHPNPPAVRLFLTNDQRRQNQRQVTGREPVDVAHLNVLRLAAGGLRLGVMRTLYTPIGLEVMTVGNIVRNLHRGGWGLAFYIAMGVALLVLLLVSIRQVRRATAFLREHPEPSPESAEASP
ncbi:hypothetical protein GCM10011512_02910 [Tersicoccus solisilvae]|uniref:Uncharacterized protein n=1 Tax=Tersicoccus solisilvae TaxID=1882339 RepID=A0ABQ1NKY2_9MICC|nr:hypothetical protein [Tersicoccus solisilvae]GGC79716.1 hypothetical protein GCM10011512_02910 [Tersicoccus solisilvae]